MKIRHDFINLFSLFITDSETGKRLQKNRKRITQGTIKMYKIVHDNLLKFCAKRDFDLRICPVNKLNKRELKSEILYWKKFLKMYTDFLYSNNSHDNYVATHMKIIKAFFNYIKNEKGVLCGDFHKNFYVQRNTIPVLALTQEQLYFLIFNKEFEKQLPPFLQRTKDIFTFGCIVGLRVSDLLNISPGNLERSQASTYLCVRSKKTHFETRIKLPFFAVEILNKYAGKKKLLPQLSSARLNSNIKQLAERAGWTNEKEKIRTVRGIPKKMKLNGKGYRFCDLVSTHTMRRTAITTLLCNGMPENMVRKISGHADNSAEFFKYVAYSQQFMDKETDSAFSNFMNVEGNKLDLNKRVATLDALQV